MTATARMITAVPARCASPRASATSDLIGTCPADTGRLLQYRVTPRHRTGLSPIPDLGVKTWEGGRVILTAVKSIRVLLFDVFGTLVDWRASLIELAETSAPRSGAQADWAAVVDDWRRAYQPAMNRVLKGAAWRDLDSLQRETLSDVLAQQGISLPAADREALVQGWRQLRPWPDCRSGLDRLRRQHVLATLSNGHVALLADLLKFADLRVDAVLSAQLSRQLQARPAGVPHRAPPARVLARGGRDGRRARF